jgi:hypothetical protein
VITDPGFAHVVALTPVAARFAASDDQAAVLEELRAAAKGLQGNDAANARLYIELAEKAISKVGVCWCGCGRLGVGVGVGVGVWA